MKIAVLYICTGRYTIFWQDFFASCESYFVPSAKKHYFVFTDSKNEQMFIHERVHRIQQSNLGWPDNTLKRFHMFQSISEQLNEYDYIFFFNANCEFRATITQNILPSPEEGLVVVQHPGFWNKQKSDFTYDRNPASTAYIPNGLGKYYVSGGVNGGTAKAYLAMIKELCDAVDRDERSGVMALWHDESHLNKYILNHPFKLLSPSYFHPGWKEVPFGCFIFVRDKSKYGGHNWLRGCEQKGKIVDLKSFIQNLPNVWHTIKSFFRSRK